MHLQTASSSCEVIVNIKSYATKRKNWIMNVKVVSRWSCYIMLRQYEKYREGMIRLLTRKPCPLWKRFAILSSQWLDLYTDVNNMSSLDLISLSCLNRIRESQSISLNFSSHRSLNGNTSTKHLAPLQKASDSHQLIARLRGQRASWKNR